MCRAVRDRGRILDVNDGSGIADATIVALDINGSARSSVVSSDDEGNYEIGVPMARDASGEPLATPRSRCRWRLRATRAFRLRRARRCPST